MSGVLEGGGGSCLSGMVGVLRGAGVLGAGGVLGVVGVLGTDGGGVSFGVAYSSLSSAG